MSVVLLVTLVLSVITAMNVLLDSMGPTVQIIVIAANMAPAMKESRAMGNV